jgi:hypothetical protein
MVDDEMKKKTDRNAEDLAMLRRIEADLALEKLRAQRTASELAAEHLGVFGGIYLVLILFAFYAGSLMLPESSLPVVATLTTLVSTALISLLRQVVTGENNGEDNRKDIEQ